MAVSAPSTGPAHEFLAYQPSFRVRLWRRILWCFHVGLHKSSLESLTVISALAFLFRLTLLFLTLTIPVWDKYLEALVSGQPKSISDWLLGLSHPVVITVAAVVALHGIKELQERLSKKAREGRLRASALNTLTTDKALLGGAIALDIETAKLSKVYPDAADRGQRVRDRCNQLCRCMLQELRLFLDELDGRYLEVTLLVYTDASASRLRVVSRGDGSGRPVHQPGQWTDSANSLAHASVFSQGTIGTPDLKRQKFFPNKSLTSPGQQPPYRSIVCLPLRTPRPDGTYDVYGVVTVDSARPYRFLGLMPQVVKALAPYAELLKPYAAASGSAIEVQPIT